MNAFRLARSLICIPRLFVTLFLFPLLLSIVFVYFQLLALGLVLKASNKDPGAIEKRLARDEQQHVMRTLLFGSTDPLQKLQVCRWEVRRSASGEELEYPPESNCSPDRLDVAIRTAHPQSFDVEPYIEIFEGKVERLHVCQTCRPDVVIDADSEKTSSHIHSLQGLLITSLAFINSEVNQQYLNAALRFETIKGSLGTRLFYVPGFREPVVVSGLEPIMALIANLALLIVITLWLALKAHRKVLDYFARNGALLPMVAATGKRSFYGAIWILTLLRVAAFLLASVPMTLYCFHQVVREKHLERLLGDGPVIFGLWIVALISALAFAAILASIADLKHRHNLTSFIYRYLPLGVCVVGGLAWLLSMLFHSQVSIWFRHILSSTPAFGIVPVLVAPVFKPNYSIIIVHTVLTLALVALLLRQNARWFSAHLEEL